MSAVETHTPPQGLGPFWKRLTVRLPLSFAAMLVLVLGVSSWIELKGLPGGRLDGQLKTQRDQGYRQLANIADYYRFNLRTTIRQQREAWQRLTHTPLVESVAERIAAGGTVTPDEIRTFNHWFHTLTDHLGSYEQIHLLNSDGKVLASSRDDRIGQELIEPPLIEELQQTMGGDVIKIRATKWSGQIEPELMMASMVGEEVIASGQSDTRLILLTITPLEQLFGELFEYRPRLGKRGNIMLVTSDGISVGVEQGRVVYLPRPVGEESALQRLAKTASLGSEGMTETSDRFGNRLLAVYRYLPATSADGWGVVVHEPLDEVLQSIAEQMRIRIGFDLMVGMVGLWLVWLLSSYLLKPLQQLERRIQRVSTGELGVRSGIHRDDEIGLVAVVFDDMLSKIERSHHSLEGLIAERTQALNQALNAMDEQVQQRTRQLQQKVEELNRTQQQLIETEKIASLGRMVAGFAHELNTPIGIVVNSTSHLQGSLTELHRLLEQDEVSELEFRQLVGLIDEASELAIRNAKRAAQLVQSFKRTASHQSTSEKRTFLVCQAMDDVLISFNPRLKDTAISLHLECPEGLEIYGEVGRLEQLIQKLLDNSFLHGFDNGTREGTIGIRIQRHADELLIEYWDTGRGLDESRQQQMFEPFYTTARNQGGSGLGLFVVYNIIVEMKGSIECETAPEAGCRFTIHIPLEETPEPAST